MSDLNGLRQVGKKRGFRLVKTLNCITHMCIFRISSKRNAHPLCFCAFRLSETQKKLEPRLSTLWVFLSVAFRLSETHIRLPEKNWGHICPRFFCAFRLSETPKIKMPFFFCISPRRNAQKIGDAIIHAFSARFSLGKRTFFEAMFSKP